LIPQALVRLGMLLSRGFSFFAHTSMSMYEDFLFLISSWSSNFWEFLACDE